MVQAHGTQEGNEEFFSVDCEQSDGWYFQAMMVKSRCLTLLYPISENFLEDSDTLPGAKHLLQFQSNASLCYVSSRWSLGVISRGLHY